MAVTAARPATPTAGDAPSSALAEDLAASRARHPSSATTVDAAAGHGCDACGYVEVTPVCAAGAVRRVTALAHRALDGVPPRGTLDRVARYRDELHATANRVERIRSDPRAVVQPVRVHAATAATSTLGPAHLRHQLDLTARRLSALLDELLPAHWRRTARLGEAATTTIPGLVDAVLHPATHDLLDLCDGAGIEQLDRR